MTATSGAARMSLPAAADGSTRILALGAHSDDIEIGCGGTLLSLLAERENVSVRWVVFSGTGARNAEARAGAASFLRGSSERDVTVQDFRDGYFPSRFEDVKGFFETLKSEPPPDIIFTHYRADRHQDHRVISDLTWNTFRSHLILEYEIPKYDGDLGNPNFFVPLSRRIVSKKVKLLMNGFASQRSKQWFTPDTFEGLLRLRGVECGAPHGFAEAFHARKVVTGP